jgi:hypothetical protein
MAFMAMFEYGVAPNTPNKSLDAERRHPLDCGFRLWARRGRAIGRATLVIETGSISGGRSGLDAKQARPDDANWSGAEIKPCCRLASLLDVPLVQAAQNIVPVAATAGDKIDTLRQWASGRCLSADRAGVYSRTEGVSGDRVRRVVRAD